MILKQIESKDSKVEKRNTKEDRYNKQPLFQEGGAFLESDYTNKKGGYMGDLTLMMDKPSSDMASLDNAKVEESEISLSQVIGLAALVTFAAIPIALEALGISLGSPSEIMNYVQDFFADPSLVLQSVVESVKSMGPLGAVYFGVMYVIAEVLAIPAIPLTASAGYLFGLKEGTAIVLLSASVAAGIGFLLGRTFLRSYVERLLDENPDFKRIDGAIGREGFKVVLLLRLSPIFPFALSNYLYGVTSVKFWPYFWGTMLGFTPGTIAYVYTGEIGKALTLDTSATEPWYIYAAGLVALTGFVKIISDVATGVFNGIDEEVLQD